MFPTYWSCIVEVVWSNAEYVTKDSVYYVQHGDGRSFLWLEPRLNYYQFQATEKPKKANHSYTKVSWIQGKTKITTRVPTQTKNRSFNSKKCSSVSVRLVRISGASRNWKCRWFMPEQTLGPALSKTQLSNYFLHYLLSQPNQTSTWQGPGVNHQSLLIVSHTWTGIETPQ